MSFQTRKPPIRIMVDVDTYNNLVELVSIYAKDNQSPKCQNDRKIKDKLLRYSIPRTNENGQTMIDIRFFNNEAQDIIDMLLSALNIESNTNYFEVLTKIRDSYKKEKQEN